MSKLEHVIFDVSGTLWNDLDQVFNSNYNILLKNGFETCPGDFNHGYANEPLCVDALKVNAVGSAPEMFRRFGMCGTDEYLEGLYKKELEIYAKEHPVELYDGVYELLDFLADEMITLSVVSSHPYDRIYEDFSRLKILGLFDSIIGSSHQKTSDIKKISSISTSKNNVIYVGDTFSDMKVANSAGIIPIGVSYGYQQKNQISKGNPENILPCPYTLKKYLESKI